MAANRPGATRRQPVVRVVGTLSAAGGALLFAWSIRSAGIGAVGEGIKRLGAGFVVIVALGGVRHLLRAGAWRLSMPPAERIRLGAAFAAFLAGDALGNVTPFGTLISEPSKIVLVRDRLSATASISALGVETVCYSATVVAMLVAGTAALLLSFPVPPAIRAASLAILAAAVGASVAAAWVVSTRRRVVSPALEWLVGRGFGGRSLDARLADVQAIEDRIYGFTVRHPGTVLPIIGLELAYHAAAVAEIWIALALITGTPPSLLVAFVLEYVNRAITVAFQFVPMWLGVDEAGTGLVTTILHLGPAPGVSLALARKGRLLAWTAAGVALLVHQGLSFKQAVQ